jgi:hypothetical protein
VCGIWNGNKRKELEEREMAKKHDVFFMMVWLVVARS